MSYRCGHECCEIRDNCYHSHVSDPEDCPMCMAALVGQPWTYTENPADPCVYCVQWRLVDPELDLYQPYWPDGRTIPKVWNGVCDRCQEALDLMEKMNR